MAYIIWILIDKIFKILNILLLLRVFILWFIPHTRNRFTELVYELTEPLLKPFRFFIPLGGMTLDLAPILAYFALRVLRVLIYSILTF